MIRSHFAISGGGARGGYQMLDRAITPQLPKTCLKLCKNVTKMSGIMMCIKRLEPKLKMSLFTFVLYCFSVYLLPTTEGGCHIWVISFYSQSDALSLLLAWLCHCLPFLIFLSDAFRAGVKQRYLSGTQKGTFYSTIKGGSWRKIVLQFA